MRPPLIFTGKKSKKCLLVVGGYDDTSSVFAPLIAEFEHMLPDHTICSFDFTYASKSGNIFTIQAEELANVMNQLLTNHNFNQIDIFCTSMGAYSTVKLLCNKRLTEKLKHIILYDPADYYADAQSDDTWSGADDYPPKERVISDELRNVKGKCVIDVVHLTLRNYSPDGYLDSDYSDRGTDHPGGYPRLNSQMVKAFYAKTPAPNMGRYLEERGVPHGFIRDGNIAKNLSQIAATIANLLSI
jgi:hypothetical protein